MALGYSVILQRNRLDEITALIDAGVGAGLLRLYDGTRPATADTAVSTQTLLAELTLSDPSFPAASGTPGSMVANTITDDPSANASGTATWFRIVDSGGNAVVDGDVGLTAEDLVMDNVVVVAGSSVSVSSATLTAGNQ